MKKLFYLLLLLFCFKAISQKKNFLFVKGDSICENMKDEVLCKAVTFYKSAQYDSCYAYSNRALMIVTGENEKDFFNCIQGYSAFVNKLYKKALSSVEKVSDNKEYSQSKAYLLGFIYLNLKEYDKAIENMEYWLKNDSKLNSKINKYLYHNLGLCYIHKKDYKNAKKYFDKELAIMGSKDTLALIRTKMDLANVYYEQYLDNEAIPLFKEAYDLAKLYKDIELKQNSAQNMAVIEENRKRFKESVGYYKEFDKWKDSIWNRDRIWELTEHDKKLAVAQKESEIALQDEKLKRQKVVQRGLLFGASGLLLFIGFLGFFYRKLRKQNTLITQQKEDLAVANKTKDYLFSVVSHDLRSPMNTIKYQHQQLKKLILEKDIEGIKEVNNTAITVTESTSHLLNNVLHWSLEQSNQMVFTPKVYPLKPIIDHVLHDYETLIEANDVEIEHSFIKNALVNVDRESIKIVLRNLLDNAVKYMNGQGKITVEMGIDSENYGYISIEDTGIGIPKERLEKINALKGVSIDKINRSEGVGLGLILCQTLVKKNKGILSFESIVSKGTKVIIQLPLAEE